MKRKMFAAMSVVSLLLCVATVVLWVRSYWVRDDVLWVNRHVPLRASVECGILRISDTLFVWNPGDVESYWSWSHRPLEPLSRHSSVIHGPPTSTVHFHGFSCPIWVPSVILMMLPLWWFKALHRRGQCNCHHYRYDLTANTSGICPECGRLVPARRSHMLTEGEAIKIALAAIRREGIIVTRLERVRKVSAEESPPHMVGLGDIWSVSFAQPEIPSEGRVVGGNCVFVRVFDRTGEAQIVLSK